MRKDLGKALPGYLEKETRLGLVAQHISTVHGRCDEMNATLLQAECDIAVSSLDAAVKALQLVAYGSSIADTPWSRALSAKATIEECVAHADSQGLFAIDAADVAAKVQSVNSANKAAKDAEDLAGKTAPSACVPLSKTIVERATLTCVEFAILKAHKDALDVDEFRPLVQKQIKLLRALEMKEKNVLFISIYKRAFAALTKK